MRESKGRVVKTFKAGVPQPDLTKQQATATVYFRARDGRFSLPLPGHIAAAIGSNAERPKCLLSNGALEADTLDAVMHAFDVALSLYERILRTEQRRKVIRFEYHRNAAGSTAHRGREIHFTLTPALALDYEILWQAGDRLYRDEDDFMADAGYCKSSRSDGTFVIEWTEERERFFATLHDGLVGAIAKLDGFVEDLAGNIDRAIAAGTVPLLGTGEEP